MNLPVFNQTHTDWGNERLGNSGVFMWNAGCMTCAVTVALNNFGHSITPGQLCDFLNAIGGYDADGLVIWNKVEELYPDVMLADSFSTTIHPGQNQEVQIKTALQRIASCVRVGIPVIVQVDVPNVGIPDTPDHFITLKYAPETLVGWLGVDSDGGSVRELKAGGKFDIPEKSIFGARILIGSPISFPSYSDPRDYRDGQVFFMAGQIARGRHVQTYAKQIVETMAGG